jgi:hypothetical protein
MSAKRELIFYALMVPGYLAAVYYDHSTGEKLESAGMVYHKSFGGRLKYLTYLNMVFKI